MEKDKRYLFLSYGPLSYSGVLKGTVEVAPGLHAFALAEVTVMGEVGDISAAQAKQVYEAGQSGPVTGTVLVPWHDVSGIYPQG